MKSKFDQDALFAQGLRGCSKCMEIKPVSEFSIYKKGNNGLSCRCKKCTAKVSKEWAKNNPEKTRESRKKYRKNNPEKYKQIAKERRKNNPEKEKSKKQEYWRKLKESPEKYKEHLKKQTDRHRERYKNDPVYKLKLAEIKRRWTSLSPDKTREIRKRYRERHLEKMLERSKTYYIKNQEREQKRASMSHKKSADELSDSYVKKLIRKQFSIPASESVPELIKLKRVQIQINREIKNQLFNQNS